MVGRTQPGATFAAHSGTTPNPARINFHSAAEHPQNVTGVTEVNEFSRAVGVAFIRRPVRSCNTASAPAGLELARIFILEFVTYAGQGTTQAMNLHDLSTTTRRSGSQAAHTGVRS